MNFSDNDYHPELGCYLRWLHGNPNKRINKMYSMSAFHFYASDVGYVQHTEYYKYAQYMELSIMGIIFNEPEYYVRLYVDASIFSKLNTENHIWRKKINLFKRYPRIQIIAVKMPRYYLDDSQSHQGLLPVMFRYLPLFDPNVSIIIFKDIDNIWTQQNLYFTNLWLDSGKDVQLFLNENYKRQQIESLSYTDTILENKFYTTILSGMWGLRKPLNTIYSYSFWQKMFAYNETYTDIVFNQEYFDNNYKYYGVRFTYGFDELMMSRVLIPLLINNGKTFYAIPIRIYDTDYFKNLFHPTINKFLIAIIDDKKIIDMVKKIILNKYWDLNSDNTGLAQYLLCLITNIYFKIINNDSNKFITNEWIQNVIKYKIYPQPLLMGLGIFTFKNFKKFQWYNYYNDIDYSGTNTINKLIIDGELLTISDLTAGVYDTIPDDSDPDPAPDNPYNI